MKTPETHPFLVIVTVNISGFTTSHRFRTREQAQAFYDGLKKMGESGRALSLKLMEGDTCLTSFDVPYRRRHSPVD